MMLFCWISNFIIFLLVLGCSDSLLITQFSASLFARTITTSPRSFYNHRHIMMLSRPLFNRGVLHNHPLYLCDEGTTMSEDIISNNDTEVAITADNKHNNMVSNCSEYAYNITNSEIYKEISHKLVGRIDSMKELLRRKRLERSGLRERKFAGGKAECYKIQAEAKRFLERKAVEQEKRIQDKKEQFIHRIKPLLDDFQAARTIAPPSNEREENMHLAYEVLFKCLKSIVKKNKKSPSSDEDVTSNEVPSSTE